MYATYEFVRKRLELQAGFENSSKASCIAGFISGIPESLIVTPTQVIKVRLQAKVGIFITMVNFAIVKK